MTELIRVAHGLHRPRHQMDDDVALIAALLSVCPPGSVVAGQAAARLHGLWLPVDRLTRPIEVVLRGHLPQPAAASACRRSQIVGRRRHVHPDDIEIVSGIPALSAARTWVNLAEFLPVPDLVAAGDSALRGSTTLDEIDAVLARSHHLRGVVRARQARLWLDERSRSRPESHLRVAVLAGGLPAPEVNEPVFTEHGEWLFEPDLSYGDVRLALEYNGAEHADRGRMRRDMTRGLDGYDRGGWLTLAFGPAEVFSRPDQVAVIVARLRDERRRHFR